jgi:hypothetical protein
MSLLFENVASQKIDSRGKTRVLNYKKSGTNLSLITSPLPPLDIPESPDELYEVTVDIASKFIAKRELKITEQDGNESDGIQGLWITTSSENPGIYYGYIPVIRGSKPLPDIPFVEAFKNDPLRTDDLKTSKVMKHTENQKLADLMKQYTLYAYAMNPKGFDPQKVFVIKPNQKYTLTTTDNTTIYSGGKIIVPSEDIKKRLVSYLKVSLLNDTPGVLALKNISRSYMNISDFRFAPNQLIFLSKESLIGWKNKINVTREHNTILNIIDPEAKEPYFYKNNNITHGDLAIIQPVKDGSRERALSVSYKWINDRINIGYDPEIRADIADISYIQYDENGKTETVRSKTKDKVASIILVKGKKTYAALLFL